MKGNFGDYIIYVDESGDHGMVSINHEFPAFVLSFCVFKIEGYIETIVPEIQRIKFEFFGHDQIIFHEHEIRKQEGDFAFLRTNSQLRNDFMTEISNLVREVDFEIFAVVIDKYKLKRRYIKPFNPYFLGLQFGMELLFNHFQYHSQEGKTISIVFERRGKKEDDALELEFRRLISGKSNFGWKKIDYGKINFNLIFADKKSNSSGLQLADLTARPIGLNYLRNNQKNRAYEIIKEKLNRCKVFPE